MPFSLELSEIGKCVTVGYYRNVQSIIAKLTKLKIRERRWWPEKFGRTIPNRWATSVRNFNRYSLNIIPSDECNSRKPICSVIMNMLPPTSRCSLTKNISRLTVCKKNGDSEPKNSGKGSLELRIRFTLYHSDSRIWVWHLPGECLLPECIMPAVKFVEMELCSGDISPSMAQTLGRSSS